MGGDSAGVDGYHLVTRKDTKVFRVGDFTLGFTTSFRMGQLLAHAFNPPKRHTDQDVYAYMVTTFIDGLRDCLKAGGWAKRDSEREVGGTFLVGYEGRLFQIEGDYQVGEPLSGYAACGCGCEVALGALYATGNMKPRDRVKVALQAAEAFSAGVRGPFNIIG